MESMFVLDTFMKKIINYTDTELQNLVNAHNSISSILRHCGVSETCPYNRNLLKIRMASLDLTLYKNNKKLKSSLENNKINPLTDSEYFCISGYRRSCKNIKTRLIKYNKWVEVCALCGMGTIWNGRKLSLQVDHINGNPFDNRLENLRFLCPNCHSQTETFGAKNATYIKKPKIEKPHNKKRVKINWPEKNILEKWVWETPLIQLSEKLGVSTRGIKNHCIKYSITLPKAEYWINVNGGNLQKAETIKNSILHPTSSL